MKKVRTQTKRGLSVFLAVLLLALSVPFAFAEQATLFDESKAHILTGNETLTLNFAKENPITMVYYPKQSGIYRVESNYNRRKTDGWAHGDPLVIRWTSIVYAEENKKGVLSPNGFANGSDGYIPSDSALFEAGKRYIVVLHEAAPVDQDFTFTLKREHPSGSIGSIKWKIDDYGTLTLSGTGEIPYINYDYGDGYNSLAYYEYWETIRSIVVKEGITSIGTGAFTYCSNCSYIQLPQSLATIDSHALPEFLMTSDQSFKLVVYGKQTPLEESGFPTNIRIPGYTWEEVLRAYLLLYLTGDYTEYNRMQEIVSNSYDQFDSLPFAPCSIVCRPGSQAEAYAKKHGIEYQYLDNAAAGTKVHAAFAPGAFSSNDVTLHVSAQENANSFLSKKYEKAAAWDIKPTVNGNVVQPNGAVTVTVPLPDDFSPESIGVYHVRAGGQTEKLPITGTVNNMVSFETTSFSVFVLVDESTLIDNGSTDEPTTPTNPTQPTNPAPQPQQSGSCRYCGGTHTGFPGVLIGFFHSILALFGLRK